MKNLILITLLFIAFRTVAQTSKPIDGFLGIKFGSTSAQVIAVLTAKGAILDKNFNKPGALSFDNVLLGTRKISYIFVHLVNDQTFESVFVFTPDLEPKSIEYYNSLVDDINGVYGKGEDHKNFKQPYVEGDGYEITAIKSGNAEYATYWRDGENYIAAVIEVNKSGKITVRLYYNDGKLRKISEDQQKSKNKADF